MGLSSSQARLLHLTSRMHQIEHKAAKLQAEKLQMANESDRVYGEYLDALEATKIQYSTLNSDGSVTYVDATYSNLCMGYISNGEIHAPSNYLGDYTLPEVTSRITGQGLQLVDSSGKVYVPQYVKNVYNNSNSAEEFAENMINYINGDSTIGDDTSSGLDTLPPDEDIILKRGDKYGGIDIKNGINLTLKDPVEKGNYQITVNDDSERAYIDEVRYMENGRLMIIGHNLKIMAADGQDDNIILLGEKNNLNTGDGNDRIRVGFAKDTKLIKGANDNTIMAGSGDDYVEILGENNRLNGETGKDSILIHEKINDPKINTIISFETEMKVGETVTDLDGDIDWSLQGNIGNCRTLSLINSLLGGLTAEQIASDYVKINCIDDKYYKVYFTRSDESIDIEKDEIDKFVNKTGETGDIETIIIERAMDQIINNKFNQNLEDCDYNYMSMVLFGNDAVYTNKSDFSIVSQMFDEYKQGKLSNFIVGTGSSGISDLGIIPNHAYSVKNVDENHKRIELVNPWDNNDSIILDADMFDKFFKAVFVFGQTEGEFQGNGWYENKSHTPSRYLGVDPANSSYNYYIDLFNMLSEAGFEGIPEGMENSSEWLSNMIASGAVLRRLDNEGNWFDTSVSTDTHLQEVQDTSLLRQAEAKYEADMRKIDRKERKYDADLATLDNERNAIKQEMDTLKTVAKENVERTFKLFS